MRWLAETVGSRPAGSVAEGRAAEGLVERLKQAGYDVELQPFTIEQDEDLGSGLNVAGERFHVQALHQSGSGVARGTVVDVGLGQRSDLENLDLHGAIALARRGSITFGEKASIAAAAGAAGVVIYNDQPGLFRGTLRDEMSIPVVALSQQDGERLALQAGARRVTAELSVDIKRVQSTSHNVVATWRGSEEATIVLGAHYDSVADGPGGNDNASGTATAIEVARVLRDAGTPYTVRVVLFGAEEIGLLGSREYVTHLDAAARERIVAMLNFDMVGVGSEPLVGGSDELVSLARSIAQDLGTPVAQVGSSASGSSDHASFIEAGIPALFFYRSNDPNYHTAEDQARHVDPDHLAFAGSLALQIIEKLGEK